MENREVKTKRSVSEAISICLENNLIFAAYRLPHSEDPTIVVQTTPHIKSIDNLANLGTSRGFLVAPFLPANCCSLFMVHPDFIFNGQLNNEEFERLRSTRLPFYNGDTCHIPKAISKEEYLGQIETVIQSIKDKQFEKAVLSRVKIVPGDYHNKESLIFSMLCETYPNAFVYMVKAGSQFWVGATPEPLARLTNGIFTTASVAGTKPHTDEFLEFRNWENKEREEQNNVTRFIEGVFNDFDLNNYTQKGPYVKKAGNLLHLRTDFLLESSNITSKIGSLVESLHPTSAVCGMPKAKTMEYLTELEEHRREYYGGFMGPVGIENSFSLFVNLRCMKIFKNSLVLYIGGGITIDSNPQEEWDETEIKAETLLSVIQKIH